MVHFERGCPYSSQGKSTLPSPLLVAALLKIVSHANIFFLWHYHSPLQEMAAYIILNHISFLMLANHSSVPFSETISHQIILSIIPSNHSLHFICRVWYSSNCLLWNYYFLFLLATIWQPVSMPRIEFDIHLMLIIYVCLTCNFNFFVLKKRDL